MAVEDSPYLFDNLEPAGQLHANPVELMQRNIPSEQWNNLYYAHPDTEGFDGFDVVWNDLTQLIGICLVAFSELESELEHNLYELVSDRASQLGMVVTRTMSFEQKIQVYIDLLRLIGPESNVQYQTDVSQLKKAPEESWGGSKYHCTRKVAVSNRRWLCVQLGRCGRSVILRLKSKIF